MKKNVDINIKGTYIYDDGEPDVVELFTTGTFQKKGDNYEISYNESSATGFEGSVTTLKIENNTVTMVRSGADASAQLIIQDGVRHQCQYDTGYGDMMIGVHGHMIRAKLDKNGGDVRFRYSLDVNTMLTSENEMEISIKESIN